MSSDQTTHTPRVCVVVPNWNGMRHLPECFEALAAQTFTDFEVIVVDNASSDESVVWLAEHAPTARVIERSDNGGFAKAVNEGIRAARSPYVVLLNNDTHADERWLERLVTALDERPDHDFAAPLMLLYYEEGVVNAAGDCYDLVRMRGKNRGLGEPVERHLAPARVLGACAGAAIYRAAFFEDVGLFDEEYFLTSEDTDLNLRALIAGKKCLYVPEARIRHKLRSSIDTHPAEWMVRLQERNEAMTFAKDMPAIVLALGPTLWLWAQLRSTVLVRPGAWRGVGERLRAVGPRLAAQREGWRMGARKRREVWQRRRVGTLAIVRWLLRGHGEVS